MPDHLPISWPRCECCREPMLFVGQLYRSELLNLDGNLALQVYKCEDSDNFRLVVIPANAEQNIDQVGIVSDRQMKFIIFTPVEDPIGQWAYLEDIDTGQYLPEQHKHLHMDKVGGLFPYDGSDAPPITQSNLMIAQFGGNRWQTDEYSMLYVYKSKVPYGFYPTTSREASSTLAVPGRMGAKKG